MAESEELHLLYRPRNFDEYLGNRVLKEGVASLLPRTHFFIFYGSKGCGKTTLARLVASHLKITNMDIHEIDAADKTGVDDARLLKSSVGYAPLGGKNKIYIIDEIHRLSKQAFDSLLKTLEEPPSHAYFIGCTTDFQTIPITIKDRAKCFEVKTLSLREAESLIDWVCEGEDIKLSSIVKQTLLDHCEGMPREIVSNIDKIRDIKADEDAVSLIAAAKANSKVIDLCRSLLRKADWPDISALLKDINEEPEAIRYAVLGYMSAVLLKGNNKQAAIVMNFFIESFMYSKRAGLIFACYQSILT